ncbi:MAG: hypothetical protein HWE30_11625 [Methylocystaceae bacterium]|nr:hypothetical protein [Methylocystaceae bacterium]
MIKTYIETSNGQIDAASVVKPDNRLFREAWLLDGPVIDVDMVRAREIWRDKIRTARMPVLENLDADFMKALEAGNMDLQQEIAEQKQVLRDATKDAAIEAAQTPEELEQAQPAGLNIT